MLIGHYYHSGFGLLFRRCLWIQPALEPVSQELINTKLDDPWSLEEQ